MLPNFIIAGATRSGTTSLYYYLKQHKDISFPKLKEPKYFSSRHLSLPQQGPGDSTIEKSIIATFEEYQNLFKFEDNKYIGDASSMYLYYYQETADEIKKVLGDIPIIIILRNPVERAYSAYNNLVRDGREFLSFKEALEKEEERINMNWDMMWAYKSVGLYYKQVKKFLTTFSNVKILFFEEFMSNPQKGLESVFNFLNIENAKEIDTSTRYSHSGKPKNKLISWFTSRKNPIFYPVRVLILSIIPRKYMEKIASKILTKEDFSPKLKDELYDFFEIDIQNLETLLEKNLNIWRKQ